MKKLFLYASLLISPFVASAIDVGPLGLGDSFTYQDVTYTVVGDQQLSITSVLSSLTELTLTSTLNAGGVTYNVVEVGANAFKWSDITNLTLPEGITKIGKEAFASSDLATITLPSTLTLIDEYAFSSSKLTSVTIPEGVTAIKNSAFMSCNSLASVTLPSTVTEIGPSCFYRNALSTVELPAGLTTLGKSAFMFCDKLTSINIPASIQVINSGTFNGCSSLTTITLPEGLEEIGTEAFLRSGLSGTITLPATLTTIAGGAFAHTNVSEIALAEGNPLYRDGDAIYSADKRLLLLYPPKSANTTYTMLNECVGIDYGAFWGSDIQEVKFSENLAAINEYAFVQSQLNKAEFPASLLYIGEQGFAGTMLTEVSLPENMPEIHDGAFAQCLELTKVSIPSAVEFIYIHAFSGCKKLAQVDIHRQVPPELDSWYDDYEGQFYDIATGAVLNVPVGTKSAYESAGYSSFDFTISETLALPIEPVSVNPENGSVLATLSAITLSYNETLTIAESNPEVEVRKGPLASGVPTGETVETEDWTIVSDNGGYRLFMADMDGFTETLSLEPGVDYYVTIPSGMLKDSEGNLSERLMLHYVGETPAPAVFTPVSFNPANDARISTFEGVTITFSEAAKGVSSACEGTKIYEGELVDGTVQGTEVGEYDNWALNGDNTTTPRLWMSDYDMMTCPLTLEEGKEYYVVIPAGAFTNAAGGATEEIIIHYSGPEASVPTEFAPVSFDPANDANNIETFDGVTITFSETAVAVESAFSGTKIHEGAVDGPEVGTDVYDFWAVASNNTSSPRLWMSDYDSYTCPVTFEKGKRYYVVIPAGSFKNLAGTETAEIVLCYGNDYNVGVEDINAGALSVETDRGVLRVDSERGYIYSADGKLVASTVGRTEVALASGTYIVVLQGKGESKNVKVMVR